MKSSLLYLTASLALVVLHLPTHAQAESEIHYGSLVDQHNDTLLVQYKGPSGTTYYTCDTKNNCAHHGDTTPDLFPTILGSSVYEKSADGRLAVKPFVVGTMAYHFLYDIHGDKAQKLALIPYLQVGATLYFSSNNDAVLFRHGTTFTRYDIASKKLSSVTLNQNLSFLTISPSGNYITGYNYSTLHHEVWRVADGTMWKSPSSMQSYLEFSNDESRVAFLEDENGFRTLYTMWVSDLGKDNPASLTRLTRPNTETEDYLYVGNTLYFMANIDGPLEWDLFAYNGTKTTLVDKDVSYGDFLKRVRTEETSYLAYLKTKGRNTNVILLSPHVDETTELSPVKDSPASRKVTREVTEYGGRTGVLLSPTDTGSARRDLFIWMHGGPPRQVAKSYHPYLSYAVYDELMERFAAGGNYVFKIDYTGSSGYGADFRKALHMKIGDVEIRDIERAIEDIKDDLNIDDVHLIGNSYGGYMALRGVVAMPKLLDGVVAINGVSDWYGLIQKIPSSPFKSLFEGVPNPQNLDTYLQASVFTGMEKLSRREKVLVVWSENDATVPVWQSEHYVEYAKEQNINLDTLSFDDEDHIIRKRENLDALCEKVTSFLRIRNIRCKL